MTFRVGQKVVKVPGTGGSVGHKALPNLTNGSVYTIREIDWRAAHLHGGIPTILIEEVAAPIMETIIGRFEPGYSPKVFRPAVERKTDISFAHEILRKATKPAPATPVALKKLDAHVWEREANEHYVEPHWCSERLFEEEQFPGLIFDPCCGFGRIPESAKKAGYSATRHRFG
jgi:hypothetical protein